MPYHRALIRVMREFGDEADYEGMCFGIGHMGMMAIFARDKLTFNQRFSIVKDSTPIALLAQFKSLQESPVKKYTWEEEIVLSLPDFSKCVMTYQKPDSQQRLFPRSENDPIINLENTERVLPHVLPPSLIVNVQDEEGILVSIPMIEKIDAFSGIYPIAELEHYLTLLRKIVENSGCKEPVCFSLNSSQHSIMVCYDQSDKKWQLINAGPIQDITTDAEIAHAVKAALSDVMGKNQLVPDSQSVTFFTMIYANTTESKLIKAALEIERKTADWKKLHDVTPEKAQCFGPFRDSWLHVASMYGQLEIVKALLLAKAPPHQGMRTDPYRNGPTPLCVAVAHGHLEISALLINVEADINHVFGMNRMTPIECATNNGDLKMVMLLLQQKKITLHKQLLFHAAQKGYPATLEALLTNGALAMINDPMDNGLTALHIAIKNQHAAVVHILLKYLANPNAYSGGFNRGSTPLLMAVQTGNPNIVLALLIKGALPNTPYKQLSNNLTPLAEAIRSGCPAIVDLLLTHRADVDGFFSINLDLLLQYDLPEQTKVALKYLFQSKGQEHAPFTALHLAVFWSDQEIIDKLLEYHPTLAHPFCSISVLELAEAMGQECIIIKLHDAIQKMNTPSSEVSVSTLAIG